MRVVFGGTKVGNLFGKDKLFIRNFLADKLFILLTFTPSDICFHRNWIVAPGVYPGFFLGLDKSFIFPTLAFPKQSAMTKIYLTEEQQSLLHNLGTTLDGRYFFIPHWLEKTDDGAFVVHPLENLPEKLSMRIQQERERSGVAYFTRLPTHLGIGDIITIEEAQTHEGGIWTDHKAEEYRILDKGLRCLMVSPKELGGRIKLTQRDLDSGCYKIRKP